MVCYCMYSSETASVHAEVPLSITVMSEPVSASSSPPLSLEGDYSLARSRSAVLDFQNLR